MNEPTRSLKRCYELLMKTYPPSYRRTHGAELLDTLLETSSHGQRLPQLREAFSLLRGGIGARARHAVSASTPAWVDGLHLGVFLLVLGSLTGSVAGFNVYPYGLWPALCALTVLATLMRWSWVALPLAVVAAFQVSRPKMYEYKYLPITVDLPFYGPGYGDWAAIAPYLLAVVGLAILARWRPSALRRWSWWWLAVPATFGVMRLFGVTDRGGLLGSLALVAVQVALLAVAVIASRAARDPRWGIAAVIYLVLPRLVDVAEATELPEVVIGLASLGLMTALAGAVVAAALMRRNGEPAPPSRS